jgi:hypothetical protein
MLRNGERRLLLVPQALLVEEGDDVKLAAPPRVFTSKKRLRGGR